MRLSVALLFNNILLIRSVTAWTASSAPSLSSECSSRSRDRADNTRRSILLRTIGSSVASGAAGLSTCFLPVATAHATVSRAVGVGEEKCRAEGNCLEKGELDGALGWDWGGRDRCDPGNPLCGPDGRLRTEPLLGKPPPALPRDGSLRLSHVAAIEIEIGRGEVGVLKLGLYGDEAPASVQQLVNFLSEAGLTTITTSRVQQNSLGMVSQGTSLSKGGIVTGIVPNQYIELGVPSQANAYARSRGQSKAGDNFQAQPRPSPKLTLDDGFVRRHDSAGLVSVPVGGIGNGGTSFEIDDEAYESAFVITNEALPIFDKQRRVVGQVLDANSMAFLERLTNVATKRGIRGVLPGQTSGPPLPRVVVRQVQVAAVAAKM